ncbi:hypothetical protein PspLS_12148 [Pyricularia sp. CBS 133598]|nr:hypothetical protein PspLS_12148 [Pyricularia sp. CBS 133598]
MLNIYNTAAPLKKSTSLFQNKIRKRRKTIFRKLEELRLCGARIYIVIEQNNKYFTYDSEKTESWPPSSKMLEKNYPLPKEYGPVTASLSRSGISE